ncbi:MAG TPA: tetratricopeptide repeat protein [Steroidobacteraceae bacterium]|jgi:tetratricopeptide (TPR) repeat protein|nr:tetratricopeptide repeat protein [Steroidobacteraceae bacterium]
MKARAKVRGPRTSRAPQAVSGRSTPAQRRHREATAHFERAFALEASDLQAARDEYRAALDIHVGHLQATINLGRLMHLNGELAAAAAIYRAAEYGSALLSFNIALLLEDLQRHDEAVAAYLAALALDPTLHDAHFHLSALHERQQRPREALQHLLAYRRLTRI